jgi:hypothetical protein
MGERSADYRRQRGRRDRDRRDGGWKTRAGVGAAAGGVGGLIYDLLTRDKKNK